MIGGLQACDAAFMDMSRHRSYLGPPKHVSSDVAFAEARLAAAAKQFDDAEGVLSGSQESRGYNQEIVRLLGLAEFYPHDHGPDNKAHGQDTRNASTVEPYPHRSASIRLLEVIEPVECPSQTRQRNRHS